MALHSPRRPAQLPAANDMAMQVRHSLARGWTVVENEAETRFTDSKVFRYFRRFEQQMAQNLVVFWRSLGNPRNRFLGNNQDVGRRLRLGISKRQHQGVFIDNR